MPNENVGKHHSAHRHSKHKGGHHGIAVLAELLLLPCLDELHGIQFPVQACHEGISIAQVGGEVAEYLF